MKKKKRRSEELRCLKKESERVLTEMIRARLKLPMNRRTQFLRKRLPWGGSCI